MTSHDPDIFHILLKFQEVFKGLGKLKAHTVKLNIDENAIPQAQPQRRVLFHVNFVLTENYEGSFHLYLCRKLQMCMIQQRNVNSKRRCVRKYM